MGTDTEQTTAFGLESRWGWPIGGALAGGLGAAAFGVFMWTLDPELLAVAIPAIYGLSPEGVLGWGIHVLHGVVMGIVFGYLVTRESILGIIKSRPDTEAISRTSIAIRTVAAGFVFGLAIWAILPLIVLPVWIEALGGAAAAQFPAAAVESLVGHLIFGIVLGLVFAITMDLSEQPARSPFE